MFKYLLIAIIFFVLVGAVMILFWVMGHIYGLLYHMSSIVATTGAIVEKKYYNFPPGGQVYITSSSAGLAVSTSGGEYGLVIINPSSLDLSGRTIPIVFTSSSPIWGEVTCNSIISPTSVNFHVEVNGKNVPFWVEYCNPTSRVMILFIQVPTLPPKGRVEVILNFTSSGAPTENIFAYFNNNSVSFDWYPILLYETTLSGTSPTSWTSSGVISHVEATDRAVESAIVNTSIGDACIFTLTKLIEKSGSVAISGIDLHLNPSPLLYTALRLVYNQSTSYVEIDTLTSSGITRERWTVNIPNNTWLFVMFCGERTGKARILIIDLADGSTLLDREVDLAQYVPYGYFGIEGGYSLNAETQYASIGEVGGYIPPLETTVAGGYTTVKIGAGTCISLTNLRLNSSYMLCGPKSIVVPSGRYYVELLPAPPTSTAFSSVASWLPLFLIIAILIGMAIYFAHIKKR